MKPVLSAPVRFFIPTCLIPLLALGCSKSETSPGFLENEAAFDEEYAATPITLLGQVVDEDGAGLPGVQVSILGWGDSLENNGLQGTTDSSGRFSFSGLRRRSVLLRLELDGYYEELLAVDLQRPLAEASRNGGTTMMVSRQPNLIRFIFGGDVMFGRRYLDGDEDGIPGEADDLIHPDSRVDDSRAILQFLRPLLASGDFTQVNLESPVSERSDTYHPLKEYKFHSHPESLEALLYCGIDAVSLGNNHVYDLLEQGMNDTLQHLTEAGIDWFGAGTSETAARGNALYQQVNGVDFAMQGFNNIIPTGVSWDDEFLYNAMDVPVKGGSLELTEENLGDFLSNSAPGRFAIPVLHGGYEYGEYPSKNMRARAAYALGNGAGLVVAHHPHTLFGVATLDGQPDAGVAILSLGNLAFDQDVFETFQSMLAVVDIQETAPGSHELRRVSFIPFHIEGYVPKLVSGDWFERIGRHVGHLSTHLPLELDAEDGPDGLIGMTLFPGNNRIHLCLDSTEYQTSEFVEELTAAVAGGVTAPIPFSRRSGSDMLAGVLAGDPARCEYGRELLHYGDFEDFDVDDLYHEGHFWTQTSERFVENSVVRSGTGALVLLQRPAISDSITTWPKNRITFPEEMEGLTVTGYLKGHNAGQVRILSRWYIRDSRTVIDTYTDFIRDPGTYDWESFVIDLNPPPDAGTLRLYFSHYPPDSDDEGRLFLDDVSLILWEGREAGVQGGISLDTPNNWSWIRLHPDDAGLSQIGVTITHREYSLR